MSDVFDRKRLSHESSEPKRNKFYRLRVYWSDDYGLTSVADEQISSLSDIAQRLDDGDHTELQLTSDEVRWLHKQLGDLVKVLDANSSLETKVLRARRNFRDVEIIDAHGVPLPVKPKPKASK